MPPKSSITIYDTNNKFHEEMYVIKDLLSYYDTSHSDYELYDVFNKPTVIDVIHWMDYKYMDNIRHEHRWMQRVNEYYLNKVRPWLRNQNKDYFVHCS